MADTFTPQYNLVEPQVGGDPDTWGTLLNGNFATIDSVMYANSVAQNMSGMNKVINGFMQIGQRPTANSVSNGQNYSAADRWKIYNANTGATISQVNTNTLAYGGQTFTTLRQQCVAAATSISGSNGTQGIFTNLEGNDCADLNGVPAVLSFIFNTNLSGSYSAAVRTFDGTTTRTFIHQFTAVANTPQRVVVPLGTLGSTYIATSSAATVAILIGGLNTGSFQGSTPDAWVTGSVWSLAGNTNWLGTNGNWIEATGVKLEAGSQATQLVLPSVPLETLRCQRYYFPLNIGVMETYCLSGSNYGQTFILPALMRISPTVSLLTTGTNGGGASGTPSVTMLTPQTASVLQACATTNMCFWSGYVYALDADF